ncbi:MAG: M15 family metallopeptidase [Methylococcus sp.]
MKPYRTLPIAECGEPLAAIPAGHFLLTEPPPYAALGAPYDAASPWMLRSGVLEALLLAQQALDDRRPGWRLKIFDAYRPNAVQAFMVNHEFLQLSGGRPVEVVAEPERTALLERAYRIWAEPSDNPATPPPHSTGAALDLTLADEMGREVSMGSPIDENSDRSNPDYFAGRDAVVHANRQLLREVMTAAGFRRHPFEWWHFSLGDQLWAWQALEENPGCGAIARYGRADRLDPAERP